MEIGYEELESLLKKRNFTKVLKEFEIKKDTVFLEKIEKYVEEFTEVEFYKKKMGKKRAMNIMQAHLIKEN